MQILNISFEQPFYIQIGTEYIKIISFSSQDPYIVKFGIAAPQNISIHREEIYESIQNQKKSVADTSTDK